MSSSTGTSTTAADEIQSDAASSSSQPVATASTAPKPDVNDKDPDKALAARIQAKKDSEELTKRLQKLALERQKESKGDRLKIIQSTDPSSGTAHLTSAKTFQELNLPKHLLEAIFAMGFDRPSAIQEEALPRILADPPRNLIGQAQSGSGKTAAFTLGMLYRINIDTPATTQALCVTPTRELAIQIVDNAIKPMAANMHGLKIELGLAQAFVPKNGYVDAHIVVGTPGKITDWIKRKSLRLQNLKVFVLDEADQMVAESGHRAKTILIRKALPTTCQQLLFSATFPPAVIEYAEKIIENPTKILIEDGPEFLMLDIIKQLWIDTRTYEGGKINFLADIYSLLTIGQSIVFVGTIKNADRVHDTLTQAGYTCSILHSGIEAAQRDATMEAFRKGESNVLISTNVLARGVDIDNVCLVINYDIPVTQNNAPDYETYLHRIGRTGRFGRKGTAINLVDDEHSLRILASIEEHFKKKGQDELIKKAEADPEALADEIEI